MHVRARKECTSVGIGGVEVKIPESGVIELPDHIAADLIQYHGFKKADRPEVRTEPKK